MDKQSTTEVSSLYEKVINFLQIKFPPTDIFISSVFYRKDASFTNETQEVNNILSHLSKNTQGVSLINHRNIANDMMPDTKRLNKDGFFAMLVNIKYVLFGFLPTTPKRNKYEDNFVSRRKYGRSNRR